MRPTTDETLRRPPIIYKDDLRTFVEDSPFPRVSALERSLLLARDDLGLQSLVKGVERVSAAERVRRVC